MAIPDLTPVKVEVTPPAEAAFVLSQAGCRNAPIEVIARPFAAELLADFRDTAVRRKDQVDRRTEPVE